jgi:hypothetical protein
LQKWLTWKGAKSWRAKGRQENAAKRRAMGRLSSWEGRFLGGKILQICNPEIVQKELRAKGA